jgi:hypothetical protein
MPNLRINSVMIAIAGMLCVPHLHLHNRRRQRRPTSRCRRQLVKPKQKSSLLS